MDTLRSWIDSDVRKDESAKCQFKDLRKAFLESLPAGERGAWKRSRFLMALTQLGYVIGDDCQRVAQVGGLSLNQGPVWSNENGRLTRMAVA